MNVNQLYKGQNEVVTHKGNGYTIQMREVGGSYVVGLIWHKRGRVPQIVKQLEPIHIEPSGNVLKGFRSRRDGLAVMEVLKNYMNEYDSKK